MSNMADPNQALISFQEALAAGGLRLERGRIDPTVYLHVDHLQGKPLDASPERIGDYSRAVPLDASPVRIGDYSCGSPCAIGINARSDNSARVGP